VAQEHYASRLPRVTARQDFLSGILLRFWFGEEENVSPDHGPDNQIFVPTMTIVRLELARGMVLIASTPIHSTVFA
jgi:hypothetical protein